MCFATMACFDIRCVDAFCSASQELLSSHAFLMGVLQATDQTIEEDFKVAPLITHSESLSYSLSSGQEGASIFPSEMGGQ